MMIMIRSTGETRDVLKVPFLWISQKQQKKLDILRKKLKYRTMKQPRRSSGAHDRRLFNR